MRERKRGRAAERVFRMPTPESLDNAAAAYLSRFAASEAGLRRVLENRIRRAVIFKGNADIDETALGVLRVAIDRIVEKHVRIGAVNDAAFAEMKIASMRRGGKSSRRIMDKLREKGIDRKLAAKAMERHDEDDAPEGGSELAAARTFARRRRLGAWRKGEAAEGAARKDYATMARAGFSRDVIREILGGTLRDDEEME